MDTAKSSGYNYKDFEDIPPPGPYRSPLDCLAAVAERASEIEERERAENEKMNNIVEARKRGRSVALSDDDDYNINNRNTRTSRNVSEINMNDVVEVHRQTRVRRRRATVSNDDDNNNNNNGRNPSPQQLPREYREALARFADGKRIEDLNLVFQKKIFETDISKNHNRLSLPKRVQRNNFLNDEEEMQLELYEINDKGKQVMNSIEIDVIEPSLRTCKLDLRKWAISNGMYVLTNNWHQLVLRNSIDIDDVFDIWSVRVDRKLCFLIVRT